MTIECYDSKCPHHGNHHGHEGPFCDEDRCIAIETEAIDQYSDGVSEAIHDISESKVTDISDLESLVAEASAKGKWSLIAPDGRAWIGFDIAAISIVVLSSMGRG